MNQNQIDSIQSFLKTNYNLDTDIKDKDIKAFLNQSIKVRYILIIFNKLFKENKTTEEALDITTLSHILVTDRYNLYKIFDRLERFKIARIIRKKPYKIIINLDRSKKWLEYAQAIEDDCAVK